MSWSPSAIASSTAGMDFARPVRVDAGVLGDARPADVRSRRCTSRTTSSRSASSRGCVPSCRRSPASTPRSIAASPRSRRPSRCRRRSPSAACGATAFTASRTSTSPACCRRSIRKRPPAGRSSPHLGNGAQPVRDGRAASSVASTMGFTAVDGLPMGTRCGNLDPGVILYLMDELRHGRARDRGPDLSASRACSASPASRATCARCSKATTPRARFAVELFIVSHRPRARLARRGGSAALDALVFTAGIGEHAAPIRERVCQRRRLARRRARRRRQREAAAAHQHGLEQGVARG